MDVQKPPSPQQPEGCLVVAVRLPVRIVALVLVVPVRMAWDALVAAGRLLRDTVLRPLGRALLWVGEALFVWPLVALWRYVLIPVGRALARLWSVLVVVPAPWIHRYVLAPVGRAVVWLVRYLLVVPARRLYTWVLAPVGRAVGRCLRGLGRLLGLLLTGIGLALYRAGRLLLVLPALALWRRVLAPAGRALAVVAREVGEALGHAWRVAGHVSRAAGRVLGTLCRWIFVEPVRWAYRTVLTPVGHLVRDAVLRPAAAAARVLGRAARDALTTARGTVRQARADVRRMLFGGSGEPAAADRRELQGAAARTLGSSTTVLTKD